MDPKEPIIAPESISSGDMPSNSVPDMTVSARQVFGVDTDMEIPAFSEPTIPVSYTHLTLPTSDLV